METLIRLQTEFVVDVLNTQHIGLDLQGVDSAPYLNHHPVASRHPGQEGRYTFRHILQTQKIREQQKRVA